MRSILYTNTCLASKDKGMTAVYIGESSRSSKERLGEHDGDRRGKEREKKSHMHMHQLTHHAGEEEPQWAFKVLRRFSMPMYRQIGEAIKIRLMQGKGANILNKKEEYSCSILPQLEVSIGGRVINKLTQEQYPNYTEGLGGMDDNKGGEEDKKRKQDAWMISNKRRKIGGHSDEQSETQN